MAMILNESRERGAKRSSQLLYAEENVPALELELAIPSRNERVINKVCDKLNETIGMWQPRSFVASTAVLYFGKLDSDNAIGTIPLYEITKIRTSADKDKDEAAPCEIDLAKKESFIRRGQSVSTPAQVFVVHTEENGYNSGKKFKFRAKSAAECQEIVGKLQRLVYTAIETHRRQTSWQKSQTQVAKVFNSPPFQMSSALLIFANFLFNVIQNQTLPQEGTAEGKLYENIDLAFTIIFTLELLMNAYGHWWRPFFSNGWSLFDLVVVFVSLLAVGVSAIPGISILRLMRVFRVIRLFGRLKALKKIINALAKSIIPVLNSFIILFLVMCIYALIGVSFFGEREPEIFGTFAQAIMVMFQLTAGESWVPGMPAYDDRGVLDAPVVAFTCSYIIIVNWTLLQVSVAVLLDNFVAGTAEEEAAEAARMREEHPVRIAKPSLDPMLQVLTDHFDNDEDLAFRINHIFDMMDEDEAGRLTREQLIHGFKQLPLQPPVHVLSEDLDQILASAGIFNEDVTKADFRKVVMRQVLDFVLRRVTDCAKNHINQELIIAQMAAFKLGLAMMDRVERRLAKHERNLEAATDLARRQDTRMAALLKHLNVADPAPSTTTTTNNGSDRTLRPLPSSPTRHSSGRSLGAMGGLGGGGGSEPFEEPRLVLRPNERDNAFVPERPSPKLPERTTPGDRRQKWREGVEPSLPVNEHPLGWAGGSAEPEERNGSLFKRIGSGLIGSGLGGVFAAAGPPVARVDSHASEPYLKKKISGDVGFVSPTQGSDPLKRKQTPQEKALGGAAPRRRAGSPSMSPYNGRDLNHSAQPQIPGLAAVEPPSPGWGPPVTYTNDPDVLFQPSETPTGFNDPDRIYPGANKAPQNTVQF